MMLLDPTLVRSAPELASLEILARVLEAALVALAAAHPCIESHRRCRGCLAPCHIAAAIHDRIDELDNAIIHYRVTVEETLRAETDRTLPF
jgi:hypothetical protein